LNVGCYRQMVQGKREVGLYLSPGKDARLHIERYWSRNEPCEVVCCWGIDPALFIAASQTFPKTVSELDFVGGMLGRPVELVKGDATSLYYPARAEIVVEGVIPPNSQKLEGPFGEFTGYYGRPEDYAFLMQIKAVHHRDNPILTHALMADYPANEVALLYSIARSARVWNDLDRVGVPGIKGVYAHPAAAGGFGASAGLFATAAAAAGFGASVGLAGAETARRSSARGVLLQMDHRRGRRRGSLQHQPGPVGDVHAVQPRRGHRHPAPDVVHVARPHPEPARGAALWLQGADQRLHGAPLPQAVLQAHQASPLGIRVRRRALEAARLRRSPPEAVGARRLGSCSRSACS